AAVLRRADLRTPETIPLGPLRIDPRRAALVSADGALTPLTARELRLLLLFAARPGEVVSREELLNTCWGLAYYGTTRTLDQHVLVLRRKMGPEGRRLVSVRSLGYKFLGA
ncbi:MAG: winged helix-turn-helix transcriptional regulator, partial [Kiritimatiellae bacterium]|nr:winged helix-turn-helix transcriptional regulator [Kiritimatiellia bacterium]